MKPIVLGFAGRIASGKSSISTAVANSLSLPRVSFGNYVRHLAEYIGLDPNDRTTLQDVGNFLVGYPRAFCTNVLNQARYQPGERLIIDGIRHKEIVDELRLLVAPAAFVLIYVAANDETIERRIREERKSIDDIHRLEQDATEAQVKSVLAEIADIRIVNDDNLSREDVVEEVLRSLKPYASLTNC